MINKQTVLGSFIIFGAVLLIMVAIGAAVYPGLWAKPYSAVFTVNGALYIGRIHHLPFSSTIKLTDGFYLQNVQTSDSDPGSLRLTPLTELLWTPKTLYLNSKNIVYTSPVIEGSLMAQRIAEYWSSAIPPQTQPPVQPNSLPK